MTIEQLKQNHADAVAAEIAGEDVEFERFLCSEWVPTQCGPLSAIKSSINPNQYRRIKPQPKLRPWKDISEVPLDAWFRACSDCTAGRIEAFDPIRVNCYLLNGQWLSPLGLSGVGKEHSLDGGKTWLPCGVKE